MLEIIDDLIKKVKIQRDLHSYFEQKRKALSILIKVINILIPGLLTLIAFADFDYISILIKIENTRYIIIFLGILSFCLFVISIFDEIFNLTTNFRSHRLSIEQYSLLIRDIKIFKKKIDKFQDNEIIRKIEAYNERYMQISSSSLTFTDKEYLKASKASKIKKRIKLEISRNPFQSIIFLKLKYRFGIKKYNA